MSKTYSRVTPGQLYTPHQPTPPPAQLNLNGSENERNHPGEGPSSGTPVTTCTQNKTKKALPLVTPLRQVVGPTGEAGPVNIPFSYSDLSSWREKS